MRCGRPGGQERGPLPGPEHLARSPRDAPLRDLRRGRRQRLRCRDRQPRAGSIPATTAATRGFHYIQGGYYRKGFEKDGASVQPLRLRLLPAHEAPQGACFTHNFLIYEAAPLPSKYNGRSSSASIRCKPTWSWAEVQRDGSTFQTKDVAHAIKTTDTCFRPVDIKLGPDGAIYVWRLVRRPGEVTSVSARWASDWTAMAGSTAPPRT